MKQQDKVKIYDANAKQHRDNSGVQTAKQATKSGINQPHNAKKEALGPNTDR